MKEIIQSGKKSWTKYDISLCCLTIPKPIKVWFVYFLLIFCQKTIRIRGVIRISTQPRQKYKIFTGRKNCSLHTSLMAYNINHKRLFHSGTAKQLSGFGYFIKKVQEAYNIIIIRFLMENSILKIFGSVDVKITPDICS